MSRCKSCNQPIEWVKMKSGKTMPVNTEKQQLVGIDPVDGLGIIIEGRFSHFAFCPFAKKHRKDKS